MAKSTPETYQSAKTKKMVVGELITELREQDVLCGKEKHCVSHAGSVNFRAIIDKYASKYQEAITKQEKMNVTKEIYDNLGSQESRFLKWNAKAKGWEELTSLLARDKISHALRFANREKKPSSSSSTAGPKSSSSKKGHRRNGSDTSNTTLSTAATELSLEDFEDMMLDDNDNSEPLDWNTETGDKDKPYVYEIPFDSMPPAQAPVYYPHHSYEESYGPHYYHQPYGHPPQPYYHPHHYHAYHHYGPAPHTTSASRHQQHYEEHQQYDDEQEMQQEDDAPMVFPEKARLEREVSMDVDLSYIMSEPLIEWDPATDAVYTVNNNQNQ